MPNKHYFYPLDSSWSTKEMTLVLHFFNQVEQAYESKVDSQKLLESYQQFKTVVPSKGEEKRLDKSFEKVSGYSTYRVVQMAKAKGKGWIKVGY